MSSLPSQPALDVEETRQILADFTLSSDWRGEHWVEVTHVNDPQDFYVRPVRYKKYVDKVSKHTGNLSSEELKLKSQIVYKSQQKDRFLRGEIQQLIQSGNQETTSCSVLATDYGFIEEKIAVKDIYNRDPIIIIPELVIHCSLSEALPREQNQICWDAKAIEAFKFYLDNDQVLMKVVGNKNGKYLVQLSNKIFRDISEILAMTGYSVLGIGENKVNRLAPQKLSKQYFTYKKLEREQRLHVRVLSGKSMDNFFVTDVQDYKDYLEELETYNFFTKQWCDRLKEEDLRAGQPVSVYCHNNSKYNRAVIQKVLNQDKIAVILIDTGVLKEVHTINVKEMSEKFFRTPAIAIYCAVCTEQAVDNNLYKFLRPGNEFFITVQELGLQHTKPNLVKIWNTTMFQ